MTETGEGMQLAGNIFNEMVMEEAIKDKTAAVEKEMNAQEDMGEQFEEEHEESQEDSDSDFNDDDDVGLRALREMRIKDMKAKQVENQENRIQGHGQYQEVTEEQFLPTVTKTKFVVVHFYHKDFERCKIMDHHLSIIARTHVETKFCKIDAEKCPFFVTKLQIQMLPTTICFMDGVAFDRVCGFEELGGVDSFPTLLLARRLVRTGCIKALNKQEKGEEMTIKKKGARRDHSSDEDEF